jgi:uncharacterized protein YxeA
LEKPVHAQKGQLILEKDSPFSETAAHTRKRQLILKKRQLVLGKLSSYSENSAQTLLDVLAGRQDRKVQYLKIKVNFNCISIVKK